MKDLAALTAKTGDEYAMFTRKGERLVIRGNESMTNVTLSMARELAASGYRWSGHTHPGSSINVLLASDGDLAVLKQFGQKYSCIWDMFGNCQPFGLEE